ncbi:MAG: GTPase Era [Oscillospiraceae bacterium]|nr:GTPase Era [Oscillospiraceae bacterium]
MNEGTINKTAMISIVGRPNVGKSTLTNVLTGDKVAIVTPKPQTTRNRIYGVFTHGQTQMVLMDTPGFHKAKTRLGDYMVGVVKESVADVDAVALMVEPIDNIGTQEEMLIEHISKSDVPAILVINKIDTINVDLTLPIIEKYSQRLSFEAIVPISARKGNGINELLEVLCKYAKEGPQLFPDGMTTDQPEKQIIAEIIREKLLICMDREIPHGTAVEITKFTEREGEDIIDVDATICCEKQSHKGMIIGRNGAMLKRIGQMAREDIERFMGVKVFLQTWVKVKENWRDSQMLMRNFGYTK